MSTQKTILWFRRAVAVACVTGLLSLQGIAQTAPTPKPSPGPRKPPIVVSPSPVIVENNPSAPQVVTILHSLNGLKVFKLLIRSNVEVEAIEKLDEAFKIAGEVHINVIAGLALDDGQTIAAWLPEAEAEMPPPSMLFAPRAPMPPWTAAPPPAKGSRGSASSPRPPGTPPPPSMAPLGPIGPMPGVPAFDFQGSLLDSADLRVITRDGKRIVGRYLGLDGLTGLSLITLPGSSFEQTVDLKEESIKVGQRLRIIGPQPAPRSETNAKTEMYVRIAETDATVFSVGRSPSGSVNRIKIRSAKLSPSNMGGIAINEAGETLGIVDAVEGVEASIVPVSLVRMAAKRVLARQASVPRPWLGIRGEPLSAASVERLLRVGWEVERARALTEKRQGILLTSVAPGSPAALAKLKPGDLILQVNNGYVRNAEDFSLLLDEANPESPVLFTIARPDKDASESMEIRLSESPDPWFGRKTYERHITRTVKPGSLMAEGVEMVAIRPRVAARLGSTGGLLVISVEPSTGAFKAGLRPGDVIESIDGQPVFSSVATMTLPKDPAKVSTCVVVRNKERIVLKFKYSSEHYPAKP